MSFFFCDVTINVTRNKILKFDRHYKNKLKAKNLRPNVKSSHYIQLGQKPCVVPN